MATIEDKTNKAAFGITLGIITLLLATICGGSVLSELITNAEVDNYVPSSVPIIGFFAFLLIGFVSLQQGLVRAIEIFTHK